MPFTLATWNINSVRLREPIVLQLLRDESPDVLCLQECKSPVDKIPTEGFSELGYRHMIDIEETALDPIAGAAAAIDAPAPEADVAAPAPAPQPKPKKTSSLSKPFIQIGIFSVEANANRTADQMRNAGMVPTVLAQSSNGKDFWRVLVGPAQSKSELSSLLKQVKSTGFSDAYAVSN
jgi:exonuclease III